MEEVWKKYIGPDPETDELYGLVCPECGEEIPEGEEKWFSKVAFCELCLPGYKARIRYEETEPSAALKELRRRIHALREVGRVPHDQE